MTRALADGRGNPPLMLEAMKAHGIDFASVPRTERTIARARCLRCTHTDQCFAWLRGLNGAFDYQWFCPNAELFNNLPRKAVRELLPKR